MHRNAFVLLLLFTAAAQPLAAQVPTSGRHGELRGVVVDNASGLPLPGVSINILDALQRSLHHTSTDGQGIFRVGSMIPGPFALRLVRSGYRTTTTPLWSIEAGELLEVEVRVDADAIVLAPLTIQAARRFVRPSPVLEDFRERAALGFGQFITRAEIERLRSGRVTDLLATVPGVHIERAGPGSHGVIYLGSSPQGRCPAKIYVDGRLLNRSLATGSDAGFTIDDAVDVSSLEGIEVYRGAAAIPAEFLTPEVQCGVVVLWTRRGDR